MSQRTETDRRAFLRGLVRWPALGALGALGGYLATRKGEPLQAGEACINRGICQGCRILGTCGLPQAGLARRAASTRPGEPIF